jgi:hypothetical protein
MFISDADHGFLRSVGSVRLDGSVGSFIFFFGDARCANLEVAGVRAGFVHVGLHFGRRSENSGR